MSLNRICFVVCYIVGAYCKDFFTGSPVITSNENVDFVWVTKKVVKIMANFFDIAVESNSSYFTVSLDDINLFHAITVLVKPLCKRKELK